LDALKNHQLRLSGSAIIDSFSIYGFFYKTLFDLSILEADLSHFPNYYIIQFVNIP